MKDKKKYYCNKDKKKHMINSKIGKQHLGSGRFGDLNKMKTKKLATLFNKVDKELDYQQKHKTNISNKDFNKLEKKWDSVFKVLKKRKSYRKILKKVNKNEKKEEK